MYVLLHAPLKYVVCRDPWSLLQCLNNLQELSIRYMFRLVLNIFGLLSVNKYLGLDPTSSIEWYIGVFAIQQGSGGCKVSFPGVL
jgi:hypothetical protein